MSEHSVQQVAQLSQWDAFFTFKILFGLVDIDSSEFFTLKNNNFRATRQSNPYKLHATNCHVDTRKYFFCRRIEAVWNSLSADVNDFRDLPAFRRLLERTNLSQFLEF